MKWLGLTGEVESLVIERGQSKLVHRVTFVGVKPLLESRSDLAESQIDRVVLSVLRRLVGKQVPLLRDFG